MCEILESVSMLLCRTIQLLWRYPWRYLLPSVALPLPRQQRQIVHLFFLALLPETRINDGCLLACLLAGC